MKNNGLFLISNTLILYSIIIIINAEKLNNTKTNINEELKKIYLTEQLNIDYFKQKIVYSDNEDSNKDKKPFILEKEIRDIQKNEDKYLSSHDNKEIFMTLFGNYTKNSNSKDLLQQYLNHRKSKNKNSLNRNPLLNDDVIERNITDWNFDYNKYEYTLPNDISQYSDFYKWKLIIELLNQIEKLPLIDIKDNAQENKHNSVIKGLLKKKNKMKLFFQEDINSINDPPTN